MMNILSPRDTTPIKIGGVEVDRKDLGAIDPGGDSSRATDSKQSRRSDPNSSNEDEIINPHEILSQSQPSLRESPRASPRASPLPPTIPILATPEEKDVSKHLTSRPRQRERPPLTVESPLASTPRSHTPSPRSAREFVDSSRSQPQPTNKPSERKEPIVEEKVIIQAEKPALKNYPDYSTLNDVEKTAIRARFVNNISILVRNYPYLQIRLTGNETLEQLYVMYDEHLNHISIAQNIDTYYNYGMAGIFFAIEWLLGKIGINAVGFAQAQMRNVITYNTMLVEISEKMSRGSSASYPIEVRFVLMVLYSAAAYSLCSYLGSKLGMNPDGIRGYLDSLFVGHSLPNTQANPISAPPAPVPSANNIPAPPAPSNGGLGSLLGNLDIGQLMGMASSFLGNRSNPTPTANNQQNSTPRPASEPAPRARRRPPFTG